MIVNRRELPSHGTEHFLNWYISVYFSQKTQKLFQFFIMKPWSISACLAYFQEIHQNIRRLWSFLHHSLANFSHVHFSDIKKKIHEREEAKADHYYKKFWLIMNLEVIWVNFLECTLTCRTCKSVHLKINCTLHLGNWQIKKIYTRQS